MKVRDLIEELQRMDPDARVGVEVLEGNDWNAEEVEGLRFDPSMERVRVILETPDPLCGANALKALELELESLNF